ncbi:MAG TPA: HDOD domain-containing protein [Spirochaetia bacterium]|nr:HDOD domain-containing protein [Spirochaetia bacterium]
MKKQIDIADIQKAVRRSVPLVFRLTVLPPESFPLVDRILELYLAELGQEKLLEPLSYCVKELISNAQKANAKRVYFEENGLEISRREDYEAGMKGFLLAMSENFDHWVQQLRAKRYLIEVIFQSSGRSLTISVKNSVSLSAMEMARIKERITVARSFHSFFEALESAVDTTEGAGLGIMILLQFLKRIGLGEKAFQIRNVDGGTLSSIAIPVGEVHLDQMRILTDVLVRDIESLPHYPESVMELIRLTEVPNVEITRIAARISRDPTLTAELLRHVNSAYYGLPSRTNSVAQAVKLIGMRSLHHLLYSFGYQKILRGRSGMKTLWEHSFRTARYAFLLADSVKHQREIRDDAYVAGILHDLGFIVVRSLHPRTQEKMRKFSMEKNIPPRILERFSFGMNHADIGATIAQKWNFPDTLVEGIKFHHEPLYASRRHRDVVFCVYLANAVCDLERRLISFDQIQKPVLLEFGIRTREHFLAVASDLKTAFERTREEP